MFPLYSAKFTKVAFILVLLGFALWEGFSIAAAQDTPDAPSSSIFIPSIARDSNVEASDLIYNFTSDSESEAIWATLSDVFAQYGTVLTRQGADIEISADENGVRQGIVTIHCVGQGCGSNGMTEASGVFEQASETSEFALQLDESRSLLFKSVSSSELDLDLITGDQVFRHVRFTCHECTIELTVAERYAGPPATNLPQAQPWQQVFAIPGRIEAENYRAGGQGVGFSDSTSGNSGGAYRTNNVDIQSVQDSSGTYNIGWITANEWLAYNIHVSKSGSYRAVFRMAAPANGSKFHIEIDGINVSGSVSVPATGDCQLWKDVSTTVTLTAGAHTLRFIAETEGFNVNYYTFTANTTGPSPTPTSTPIPTLTPTPTTVPVKTNTPTTTVVPTSSSMTAVDKNVVVNPFRPEMLGVAHVNWEHAWGKPFSSQVPGLTQAYKAAKIKIVRYAGGLWANHVGWERVAQRTPYTDWQPSASNYHADFSAKVKTNLTYSFHYGKNEIDDLGTFSKNADVAIIIQVNIANNDPAMWADLVQYANVEHDYKFKYWEIGNELDHDTALNISPEEYASRLAGYVDAMKAVDPSIIIMGGVPASGHDYYRLQDYSGATTDVSHYLHQSAALRTPNNRKVDALSYHWYQNCNNSSVAEMTTYAFEGVPNTAWQNVYSRVWSRIGPERVENEVIKPKSAGILQGITELNYDACDFDAAPQSSNHMTSIWAADVIGRLAYYGLDYLTWYEGYGTQVQGYPLIYSTPNENTPTGIALRPTYYTFFMYGNYFGDQMVKSSSTTDPALSVYASTDSDEPGTLKLMVVNLTNAPIVRSIALSNFTPQTAGAYVLSNPNPTNMNDASNTQNGGTTINGVVLNNMNVSASSATIQPKPVSISGTTLTYTFAPYSATAIIVK